MRERDRFFDAVIRDEMRRINSHLPKDRRTLGELLTEDVPSVSTVDGHLILMRKNELEELASSIPGDGKERVKLPLIFLRRNELGPGSFTVLGDPYEEYAAVLLAGSFKGTFEEFKRQKRDPLVLYKPQISGLLRRFHSLIVLGFGVSDLQAP